MIRTAIALAASLLLVAGLAHAEGMHIEPGKWEFKTTSRMPMQPAPRQTTEIQCVEETEMDPRTFMKDSPGCTLSDVSSDAGSMRWKLTCASPGGSMTGEAEVHSGGDTMRGTMKAGMTVQGQRFELEQKWEGRRLGNCD